MDINYSIVIPHKNSPDTLAYCLSTIPIRDDAQVIVVDDNSDPAKVDFEHFPQWGGENYECYFTKEGRGAGYARNVGLSHAKGKWVLFADADDYLLPELNIVFDDYLNSDAELIYFRPKAVMIEDRQSPSSRADWYNGLIDDYERSSDENNLRCRFFVPWSKFIKKTLIDQHDIRFDEIAYSNDAVFSVLVGCKAKSIRVDDRSYYVVTQSAHSLTSSFLSKPGELEIRAEAFFKAQQIIYSHGKIVDYDNIINYLRWLFPASKSKFFQYFKVMHSFGYPKMSLINKLFEKSDWKSRIKRSLYVLVKTI